MDPPQTAGERLPVELVYDIIVDIFAEYLHHALTGIEPPKWNAFAVIPCVSRVFHSLSEPLLRKIFGEQDLDSVEYVSSVR
jgi:hypothetical protein